MVERVDYLSKVQYAERKMIDDPRGGQLMEKFSEIVYTRPDAKAAETSARQYLEHLKQAKSYEEMKRLFTEHVKENEMWSGMQTVAHIRNTIDTRDEFYEKEMQFFHEMSPKLELLDQQAEKIILESPYRDQWEADYGAFVLKNMEINQKLSDEAILQDLVKESELCQKYSKASATASTIFRGEECNFYGLLKHMQSTDRDERKEAMKAWGDLYEKISGDLDSIYDQMVELRVGIAKKLGFGSYIEFVYLNRGRYDYTAKDVEVFRKQVRDVIVPICSKIRQEQAKRLGVDKLHYYDEPLYFADGNPMPQGNKDTLVKKAQHMYHEISKETGEFFDFMADHELFDLETKPGKRQGGYCTFIEGYNAPFIFSNFNGTSADVDVLTHEAGHAFEVYTAAPAMPIPSMVFPTMEIAEIHSMSMEHFAYPWMKDFFGEKADDYCYAHLAEALVKIPYMVAVDEFQHRVFEKPAMTAKERRTVWHELEKIYLPWRDYDGHPFLEEGGFWMQKQHIFLFPFYYIDYALAQICAIQFYGRAKKDRKKAWADYYRLCQAGGSKGYFDLLKLAELDNPFHDGTVKKTVDGLLEDLFK